MLARIALCALLLLSGSALAQGPPGQGGASPTGQFTPGHALRAMTPSGSPYGDAGGAKGSRQFGQGYLTEIGITNTGSPLCINDALITGPYHQLCLGANSLGGGLITYGAFNGAPALGLNCLINGVLSSCLGGGGTSNLVVGTTTITNGSPFAILYNNRGTLANISNAGNDVLISTVFAPPVWSHVLPSGLNIPSPNLIGSITTPFTPGAVLFVGGGGVISQDVANFSYASAGSLSLQNSILLNTVGGNTRGTFSGSGLNGLVIKGFGANNDFTFENNLGQTVASVPSGSTTWSIPGELFAGPVLATSLQLTGGTVTNMPTPVNGTDGANKAYVDAAALGLTIQLPVQYATTAALPASTYANGTLGVGATLTETGNGALSVDGNTPSVSDRILVKDQAAQLQNGAYSVTAVGDGSNPYVLTRVTDYDQSAEIKTNTYFFVQLGTANAGSGWIMTTAGTITVGTTAIVFTQFTASTSYSAGAGLTLTGTTFKIGTGQVVNSMLSAGSFTNITGTGVLTTGSTGTGFGALVGTSVTVTGDAAGWACFNSSGGLVSQTAPCVGGTTIGGAFTGADGVTNGTTTFSAASRNCVVGDAGNTIIIAGAAGGSPKAPLVTTVASCSGNNYVLTAGATGSATGLPWGVGVDNTAALASIVAAHGTINLPPGQIILTNTSITLNNVALVGAGPQNNSTAAAAAIGTNGTTFVLTGSSANPFIVQTGVTLKGLNYYWPGQAGLDATPITYPALFADDGTNSPSNVIIDKSTVVNAYRFWFETNNGVINSGNLRFTNDSVYAVQQVFQMAQNSETLYLSNFIANPSLAENLSGYSNLLAYTLANGEIFTIVGNGSGGTCSSLKTAGGLDAENVTFEAYARAIHVTTGILDESHFRSGSFNVGQMLVVDTTGGITGVSFNGRYFLWQKSFEAGGTDNGTGWEVDTTCTGGTQGFGTTTGNHFSISGEMPDGNGSILTICGNTSCSSPSTVYANVQMEGLTVHHFGRSNTAGTYYAALIYDANADVGIKGNHIAEENGPPAAGVQAGILVTAAKRVDIIGNSFDTITLPINTNTNTNHAPIYAIGNSSLNTQGSYVVAGNDDGYYEGINFWDKPRNLSGSSSGAIPCDGATSGANCSFLNQHSGGFSFIAGGGGAVATIDGFGNEIISGNLTLSMGSRSLFFTDTGGSHPLLSMQGDNNLVLYSTNSGGFTYPVWSVLARSDNSVFQINAPGGTQIHNALGVFGGLNVASGTVYVGSSVQADGGFINASWAGNGNRAACINNAGQLYESGTTNCP